MPPGSHCSLAGRREASELAFPELCFVLYCVLSATTSLSHPGSVFCDHVTPRPGGNVGHLVNVVVFIPLWGRAEPSFGNGPSPLQNAVLFMPQEALAQLQAEPEPLRRLLQHRLRVGGETPEFPRTFHTWQVLDTLLKETVSSGHTPCAVTPHVQQVAAEAHQSTGPPGCR